MRAVYNINMCKKNSQQCATRQQHAKKNVLSTVCKGIDGGVGRKAALFSCGKGWNSVAGAAAAPGWRGPGWSRRTWWQRDPACCHTRHAHPLTPHPGGISDWMALGVSCNFASYLCPHLLDVLRKPSTFYDWLSSERKVCMRVHC